MRNVLLAIQLPLVAVAMMAAIGFVPPTSGQISATAHSLGWLIEKVTRVGERNPVVRKEKESEEPLDILPKGYYHRKAPPLTGNQTGVPVKVSITMLDIKLDPGSKQAFDVHLLLALSWNDSRLQWPSNLNSVGFQANSSGNGNNNNGSNGTWWYMLSHQWHDRLWVPYVYFGNVRDSKLINTPLPMEYFWVVNRTRVIMKSRMWARLFCRMNLVRFPFDTQRCFINVVPISDTSPVVLQWNKFTKRVSSHHLEFEIVSLREWTTPSFMAPHGDFQYLQGELRLSRNVGNYLIRRFIPSSVIVVLSFLGLWIPITVASARISLSITALLALVTQQAESDLTVSYVYALQVWNIASVVFVFAGLFQVSLSMYARHQWEKAKKNQPQNAGTEINNNNNKLEIDKNELQEKSSGGSDGDGDDLSWCAKHFRTTSRHTSLDRMARWLLPGLYLAFILLFTLWVVGED